MSETHAIRPLRSYSTTDARTALPKLVNEMVLLETPAETLTEHAIEVGPRNRGGVWMLPAIDVTAAIAREAELRERLEQLEDEAENVAIGMMLTERLEHTTDERISGEDFIRELGFPDIADSIASGT